MTAEVDFTRATQHFEPPYRIYALEQQYIELDTLSDSDKEETEKLSNREIYALFQSDIDLRYTEVIEDLLNSY